jgi:antitoxin component of MazEF toxin-antitoxin module
MMNEPKQGKEYRLDDLVRLITCANLHEEIDTGDPVGNEEW